MCIAKSGDYIACLPSCLLACLHAGLLTCLPACLIYYSWTKKVTD